jgi:hypothetical protein
MSKQISYDDILSSLNMKVENGRLVIMRDIEKEQALSRQKTGALKPQQQQPQKLQQQQQQPQPPKAPLDILKEHLNRQKQKKMFMQEVATGSNSVKMDYKSF